MSGDRLRLNPIGCDAHGLCAGLLPEMITLDEWGYPILSNQDVPEHLLPHARRAVAACPTLALALVQRSAPAAAPRPAAPVAPVAPVAPLMPVPPLAPVAPIAPPAPAAPDPIPGRGPALAEQLTPQFPYRRQP